MSVNGEIRRSIARHLYRNARYASTIVGSDDIGLDIAQETAARALERDFSDPSEVENWTRIVTRNLALDEVRRRERHNAGEVPDAVDPDVGPEAVAERREAVKILLGALEKLPGDQAELLWAYYVVGENAPTIADRLGVQPSAVRKRLERARVALKAHYLELGGPASTFPIAAPIAYRSAKRFRVATALIAGGAMSAAAAALITVPFLLPSTTQPSAGPRDTDTSDGIAAGPGGGTASGGGDTGDADQLSAVERHVLPRQSVEATKQYWHVEDAVIKKGGRVDHLIPECGPNLPPGMPCTHHGGEHRVPKGWHYVMVTAAGTQQPVSSPIIPFDAVCLAPHPDIITCGIG